MYRDEVEDNILSGGIPTHPGELKVVRMPLGRLWLCQYTEFLNSEYDSQRVAPLILYPMPKGEVPENLASSDCRLAKDTYWNVDWRDLTERNQRDDTAVAWPDIYADVKRRCSFFSTVPEFIIVFASRGFANNPQYLRNKFLFADDRFWTVRHNGWIMVPYTCPRMIESTVRNWCLEFFGRAADAPAMRANTWTELWQKDPEEAVNAFMRELGRVGRSLGWKVCNTRLVWSYLYRMPPAIVPQVFPEDITRTFHMVVQSARGPVLVYNRNRTWPAFITNGWD